jgi:hypothetical protein
VTSPGLAVIAFERFCVELGAPVGAVTLVAAARSTGMSFMLRRRRAQVKRVLALIDLYSRG